MGTKIGVLGGGSWATAIIKMLLNNEGEFNWWVRREETANYIKEYKHNPNYLRSVELDTSRLHISNDLSSIIADSDYLILCIPSAFIHTTLVNSGITEESLKGKVVFSAVKGIVPEYHSIIARYIHKQFRIPYDEIGVISGPCHAEEVAMEKLSYLTVSSQHEDHTEYIANQLECRYIKTNKSEDIFGTEISAVLKNVYAIASGICHGLGYGDNFQAVLISNAIQEIERFIDKVNPLHRDVKNSAYLGDLLVTAYSQFSRNRTFGNMLGKGYSVKSAQMEMDMIAEGFYAVKSIMEINKKFNVEMPICQAVYNIIYERISPGIEMRILCDRLS